MPPGSNDFPSAAQQLAVQGLTNAPPLMWLSQDSIRSSTSLTVTTALMLAREGEPFSSSRTVKYLVRKLTTTPGGDHQHHAGLRLLHRSLRHRGRAIQAGVECEGAAAGEDEKEEREAVQDREFAAVGHRDDAGR
jgi:hypothetical protein